MDKGEKFNAIISIILIAILAFTMVYIFYTISDDSFDKEYIIVEGKVIEVIPAKDDDGSIEYYHVYFDTGEKYRLKPTGIFYNSIDFTTNSKLIVELYYYPNQNEDFKYIGSIVKVPDGD